jgi:beta-carotene/zeaxanthin 4-ketolase
MRRERSGDGGSDQASDPRGEVIAAGLMGFWFVCLIGSLRLRLPPGQRWLAMPLSLVLTFLYSGLFITAHDAVHGSVSPDHPRVNDTFGRVASTAFALFSFDHLRAEHMRHHAATASTVDPDYHDGNHAGVVRWYLRFMFRYMRPSQIAGLAAAFGLLRAMTGASLFNLISFWVIPPLLSSLQLFYFGTYLPHREPPRGHVDHHRATSNDLSWLPSLVACYHFGYHHEHHEEPHVPWWRLPALRRAARAASAR